MLERIYGFVKGYGNYHDYFRMVLEPTLAIIISKNSLSSLKMLKSLCDALENSDPPHPLKMLQTPTFCLRTPKCPFQYF